MTESLDNIENFCSCGQPSMWDHTCEITEVTDMSKEMDYEAQRAERLAAIGDNIRELQYLLVPQYEAQAERCRQLYHATFRHQNPIEPDDKSDTAKAIDRLQREIADGHALLNPLLTGIKLLQSCRDLL